MIFTGYYARLKDYPHPINIAGWPPKWTRIPSLGHLLAPKKEWFFAWKDKIKEIDDLDLSTEMWGNCLYDHKQKYIKLYTETVLDKISAVQILAEIEKITIEDCTLVCFEGYNGTNDLEKLLVDGDFCHRHIVSKFLRDHKIPCEEFI